MLGMALVGGCDAFSPMAIPHTSANAARATLHAKMTASYDSVWDFRYGSGHYEPISTGGLGRPVVAEQSQSAQRPPAAALLPNADSENAAKAAWLAKNSDQAAWGGPQATSTSGMVVSTAPGALVAPSTNAAMEFEAQGRMYTDHEFRHSVGKHYGATIGSCNTDGGVILGGVVPTGGGQGNRVVRF